MATNPPKRQALKPKRSVIRWLLDSDPSVGAYFGQDVRGIVDRLLAEQLPDGGRLAR